MSDTQTEKKRETKNPQPSEIFCIQLENKTVELKMGLDKFKIMELMGTHRGVELCLNNQEKWYYRFLVNGKTHYHAIIITNGELTDVTTTIK
jgi:hypothetical protein